MRNQSDERVTDVHKMGQKDQNRAQCEMTPFISSNGYLSVNSEFSKKTVQDLKSWVPKGTYRFDSGPRHHQVSNNTHKISYTPNGVTAIVLGFHAPKSAKIGTDKPKQCLCPGRISDWLKSLGEARAAA